MMPEGTLGTIKEAGSGAVLSLRANFKRLDGPRLRWFAVFLLILVAAFSGQLWSLVRFSYGSELYSHAILIPVVAAYLVGLRLGELQIGRETGWRGGLVFLVAGFASLWLAVTAADLTRPEDRLAFSILGFLALAVAGAFFFLGTSFVRAVAFPICLLVFMAPFPVWLEHGIEMFFQRTSAEAASVLLKLTSVPVFRDGMFFRLPGILIEVAEECSGIRSSLVLFITSLVAGAMLLRKPWTRAVLTIAVIPLGIIRNGFRILTISLLCVHVGPEMIDSPIHHRGGPLFFVLSLIPFFGLLILLRKLERTPKKPGTNND